MEAFTSSSRSQKHILLLKLKGAYNRDKISLTDMGVEFTVESLMPHVASCSLPLGATGALSDNWYQLVANRSSHSDWDICHHLASGALGIAAGHVVTVEPDLIQRWPFDSGRTGLALAASNTCGDPAVPDARFPSCPDSLWYQDSKHSDFDKALKKLSELPASKRSHVRVAHLDTGFDPQHGTLPAHLAVAEGRNFIDGETDDDARDATHGPLTNRGHGTGTLGILAGINPIDPARPIGAAPFVEVIPMRVANRVVLFSNGSIARALDHVLSLANTPKRIDIVTMSMGGLASQAWADAINALYEAGVFVVTAAGNNFGNLPTRNLVYPARFNRVVAACGVMADGSAYADLPQTQMAGNYGPESRMRTAMAAPTPNLPWARLGCPSIVDGDGAGTSSATPQIAAAAAIWLAAHGKSLTYSEPWQRVEAIRAAIFGGAISVRDSKRLGRGKLSASRALANKPAPAASLIKEARDDVRFPFLTTLFGLGVAPPNAAAQQMLELEALQLSQHWSIEALLPDPHVGEVPPDVARELAATFLTDARASAALRAALAGRAAVSAPEATVTKQPSLTQKKQLLWAKSPDIPKPANRKLRVFASDPSMATSLSTYALSETVVEVPWEPLEPGPVGEYIEVIDIDPPSNAAYAPVDLDNPWILHEHGLKPSETDPRFHQQMVYAVASRTIHFFEQALGRKALWSPHRDRYSTDSQGKFVQHLRIYPHAMRTPNAYYSPTKKALLFGYFKEAGSGDLPASSRATVFSALSHDVVAHETAHALLDGLHRRFTESTNPDVLAFHEGFADIVAIFQHFTMPSAVRAAIAETRGDLFKNNRLGQLAVQFGQAIGKRGALRVYIGSFDEGVWKPNPPKSSDYQNATEAHDRGAVLVAAVFDAFLSIYHAEARDVIALATGGSGVLPEGELAVGLIDALTDTACRVAERVLQIMIRGLDYCPPFDITFGEYLRAIITADRDLVPDDKKGYRVAIVTAFRARGIFPNDVRSVSPDTLAWEKPIIAADLSAVVRQMETDWPVPDQPRADSFRASEANARIFWNWLIDVADDDLVSSFGIYRKAGPLTLELSTTDQRTGNVVKTLVAGMVRGPEVHSVRALRRVGPDRTVRTDIVVELTQSWRPDASRSGPARFRGGCTLLIDRTTGKLQTLIRKRVDNSRRYSEQCEFIDGALKSGLGATYFAAQDDREPFAMIHNHELR